MKYEDQKRCKRLQDFGFDNNVSDLPKTFKQNEEVTVKKQKKLRFLDFMECE